MKITIVYDNEVHKENLEADWGFSCLIEVEGSPRILFDTGASGTILLHNMEKLNINPKDIGEIFISHSHGDHTGGLLDFLKLNKEVKVYAPTSCKPQGVKEVIRIKEPLEIHETIFSTGELQGIEQSMVIKTLEGLVIVDGCSHPGVGDILKAASNFGKVYALIGGLHGFNDFDLLKDLNFIYPCHCTQYKTEIKLIYPEKCSDCGAGEILEL